MNKCDLYSIGQTKSLNPNTYDDDDDHHHHHGGGDDDNGVDVEVQHDSGYARMCECESVFTYKNYSAHTVSMMLSLIHI